MSNASNASNASEETTKETSNASKGTTYVRLLNGDMLALEGSYSSLEAMAQDVATTLGIYHSQVVLSEWEEENKDQNEDQPTPYICYLRPKPVVRLPSKQGFHTNINWLATATNECILRHYLDIPNVNTGPILANPHPIVVEHILSTGMTSDIRALCYRYFYVFSNPADSVVDHLLQVLETVQDRYALSWGPLSSNRNKRIVDYLLEHHPDRIRTSQFGELPHDNAVQFTWDKESGLALSRGITFSVLENTESDLAITYQMKIGKRPESSLYSKLMQQAGSSSNVRLLTWFLAELEKQRMSVGLSGQFFLPSFLFANSSDLAVGYILANMHLVVCLAISSHSDSDFKYLSKNSHPLIVEWLFEDPEDRVKFPHILSNSHPRAIEYCKKHITAADIRERFPYRRELMSNPNLDLVLYVLHTFPEEMENVMHDVETRLAESNEVDVVYNVGT